MISAVQKLTAVLKELETETGRFFQITIDDFNDQVYHIGTLSSRSKLRVSMDNTHQELDGEYSSLDNIIDRIQEFHCVGVDVVGTLWKCPKCGFIEEGFAKNRTPPDLCINIKCPGYRHVSKWKNLEISSNGDIIQPVLYGSSIIIGKVYVLE